MNLNPMKGATHHEAKKVMNIQTGEIFGTIKEAAKHANVSYARMIHVLKGETKDPKELACYKVL